MKDILIFIIAILVLSFEEDIAIKLMMAVVAVLIAVPYIWELFTGKNSPISKDRWEE